MVTFDARDPGTASATWVGDPRFAALPLLSSTGVVFSSTGVERMIVVAAHPDDETLGAGALIASAAAHGIPTEIVIVTDGAASHPGSPTLDTTALAATRAAEAQNALRILNPDATLTLLGFPDGAVLENRAAITAALRPLVDADLSTGGVGTARGRTLLVCPWRGDGHRDHRVVGEICAALAAEAFPGSTDPDAATELVEYPIWLWHWGTPGLAGGGGDTGDDTDTAAPWGEMVALQVDRDIRKSKRAAIAAYRSQTEPLSEAPGDEALLNPTFLQNFDRDLEVFIVADRPQPTPQLPGTYFDDTYARHDDPWGFTNRWYEERKRAVTLAALPREHFANTLEIGCSIGVLTAQLAPRTDHLLAVDIAPAAIDRARERLAGVQHVELEVRDVADTFPADAGPFDLILLSEVGYYFDEPTLRRVLDGIAANLTPDGVFVACHWRHPVADYLQTGDGVHRVIADVCAASGSTRLLHHLEEDFVLDVYSPDPRSVAEQTGLL